MRPIKVSQEFCFLMFLCVLAVGGFFLYQTVHPSYVHYKLALNDIAKGREPTNIAIIAIELQNEPEMLKKLSNKLHEQEMTPLGIVAITPAFFYNPADKEAALALSGMLWSEARNIEALSTLVTAVGKGLKLDQDLAEQYVGLAAENGFHEKALAIGHHFEKTPVMDLRMSIALAGVGRLEEAEDRLSSLVEFHPDETSFRLSYARVLLERGKQSALQSRRISSTIASYP